MNKIQENLQKINNQILEITKKFKICSHTVKLLIVSKNRSINDIQKVISYGQYSFGENYVQESKFKIQALNNNIQWHFLGKIQSNKIPVIAKIFSWCHTITNEKEAMLLNKYRTNTLPKLNVLIQINIRKKHLNLDNNIIQLKKLAKAINELTNLKFRGIMAMPYKTNVYCNQIESYKHMKTYFDVLKKIYPLVDTLSIGTSHDIQSAILSGSTLLRIGSAIFNV